jgi:hypothetical protein
MSWSIFTQNTVTPAAYAKAVLSDIGAPETAANIQSLIAWMLMEGGGGTYNPLNSTQTSQYASGNLAGNSAGVKNYDSASGGASSTAATLENGYYPAIVAALKAGKGLDGGGSTISSELSTWSGEGYSALASVWNEAASYMTGGGTVSTTPPVPGGGSSTTGSSSGSSSTGSAGSSAGNAGGTYASTVSWQQDVIQGLEWPGKWVYDETVSPIANAVQGTAGIVDGISKMVGVLNRIGMLFATLFRPSFWLRVGAFAVGCIALFEGIHFLKISLEQE